MNLQLRTGLSAAPPQRSAQPQPGGPVRRRWPGLLAAAGLACGWLAGCSDRPLPQATETAVQASSGQVAAPTTKVSFYAASRFADQASFGPTPELVAELQAKGFEAWLDEQFALPVEPIDPTPLEHWVTGRPVSGEIAYDYFQVQFGRRAVASRDQLRLRVAYSLGNWIVMPVTLGGHVSGGVVWFNLLQTHAFGRYGELLRAGSVNPSMGWFLGNAQNRPRADTCPTCAPNENFARELMQLFSIGTVALNADGSARRDAAGRVVESYTQRDVAELARALTGWTYDPDPPDRVPDNFGNWRKPMRPSAFAWERDPGAKTVLGRTFPAGQGAEQDLDAAIELLTRHPNAAPFVALRLIQHLVTSNPSPGYVQRVGAVFRDNGRGQVGDLKAMVRAVLLDAEARAGDVPGQGPDDFGKFREPALHRLAIHRGMGCERQPDLDAADGTAFPQVFTQRFLDPPSVFGWYQPTDRAPGSGIVAPEHQLLHAGEFAERTAAATAMTYHAEVLLGQAREWQPYDDAGCDRAAFRQALAQSSQAWAQLVGRRFFRGAPPATLPALVDSLRRPRPDGGAPFADLEAGSLRLISAVLMLPEFGVIE